MRRMIEVPLLPTVWGVAVTAILPQPAVVNVVPGMASGAIPRRIVESFRGVTLRARDDHMQTGQRVARLVMIEIDFRPLGSLMTPSALAAQAAAVRFVGPMAVQALASELLIRNRGCVAGVAIELRVGALEAETSLRGVIEIRHPPVLVSVAIAALLSEPGSVAVVRSMTAGAVFRHWILRVAATMAIPTSDRGVPAEEGKARFARVIESLRAPVGRRMTACALRSLTALVNIIGQVTAGALPGCAFVLLAGMAGGA